MSKGYSSFIWKCIPHEREVVDLPEVDDLGSDYNSINFEIDETRDKSEPIIEYRDEANRPWWKFFDEYEYRYNKFARNSTVESPQEKSKAERRLVRKLDLTITLFAIISYWSKMLDQTNISNAYVSGMKEDLNMQGDDYSNATAVFSYGSILFQAFYMWLFPRVDMHLLFFIGDVFWSAITILTAWVDTPKQLMWCRFLVGVGESGYFIQIHYLLGSWFKPDELGRRGTVSSGIIQAWIFQHLNGVNGRAGWRWMFLIDGVATMTIGFLALYMVPGTPYKCCSLFLTDDEIRLARTRLKKANIKPPSKDPPPFFDKQIWKNILSSWRVYILSCLNFFFWHTSSTGFSNFALWLKSLNRFDTPSLNRITSIPPALGLIWILLVCGSADWVRSRAFAIFWAEIFVFIGTSILAKWDVAEGLIWFAFMISYFGISVSSVVYGWLNDIMRYDPQERSIVLCLVNMFANTTSAIVIPKMYKTSEAPEYHNGYTYSKTNSALLMIWSYVTLWFYKRQEKRDSRSNGIVLYNSKTGYIPLEAQQYIEGENERRASDGSLSSIGKNTATVEIRRSSQFSDDV
ncbi:putative transporter SEO1 [Wickerhamomyces ciferrii]|uniref:Transporter SEO1 n=1 Tax=Wickerhamomyces ciferrii (strain ATCC 14091 / BCRC 22168 / CBS 111 / JCM 3599 / NBRC 0793 / NRRL Y-1031 F-60-10) TaxID=1206466 RepID=K0KDJ0_WICCF|nr:putative transporter SEO1 [Wickerhamomyces ciferrii]CCH43185.1 putative transporter SEO1 [Wickerhamomyces ciferrii]